MKSQQQIPPIKFNKKCHQQIPQLKFEKRKRRNLKKTMSTTKFNKESNNEISRKIPIKKSQQQIKHRNLKKRFQLSRELLFHTKLLKESFLGLGKLLLDNCFQ